MTASVLCSVIIFAANYSFKEKPPGLDFPLLLVDEYISNYIFLILKMKNMNSMNGTFMGIANLLKKTKIWSGNNQSWPVYNIYRYMCKVLFRSGDWYVYLYQFSFPLKDDCTLDRRVLYIWKYLLLIWRTPPCGDK